MHCKICCLPLTRLKPGNPHSSKIAYAIDRLLLFFNFIFLMQFVHTCWVSKKKTSHFLSWARQNRLWGQTMLCWINLCLSVLCLRVRIWIFFCLVDWYHFKYYLLRACDTICELQSCQIWLNYTNMQKRSKDKWKENVFLIC